jgi:GTP-binding protein
MEINGISHDDQVGFTFPNMFQEFNESFVFTLEAVGTCAISQVKVRDKEDLSIGGDGFVNPPNGVVRHFPHPSQRAYTVSEPEVTVNWQRLVTEVEFLGSFPKRFPDAQYPEVAFVGRSNVGKSSAINSLLNRKAAARVSSTPGRTQAVNLFRVGEKLCFADLPGYGFAKAPMPLRKAWKKLVARYLFDREALALVVQLVDARHPAQKVDIEMLEMLTDADVPFVVVATKVDRVKRSKRDANFKAIAQGLGINPKQIIPFSTVENMGQDVVWSVLIEVVEDFDLGT